MTGRKYLKIHVSDKGTSRVFKKNSYNFGNKNPSKKISNRFEQILHRRYFHDQ